MLSVYFLPFFETSLWNTAYFQECHKHLMHSKLKQTASGNMSCSTDTATHGMVIMIMSMKECVSVYTVPTQLAATNESRHVKRGTKTSGVRVTHTLSVPHLKHSVLRAKLCWPHPGQAQSPYIGSTTEAAARPTPFLDVDLHERVSYRQ